MSCLMIMAGGTGGHVFPALAVANHLSQQGVKIVWLGTAKGIEGRLVPAAGYETHWISVQGLRGNGLLRWLLAPFSLLRAVWQALQIMRKVKPDCVLGMGGFASGPGGIAAVLLGKPLVVHEQNAVAGLTNKWLAKVAKSVLSGFRNTIGLPDHAVWVGNPVREDIAASRSMAAAGYIDASGKVSKAKRVLILGGSQGAHSLNKAMPNVLSVIDAQQTLSIWHQAGRERAEQVITLYAQAKNPSVQRELDVQVTEFIDDMAAAYAWADIIICRAGAMTVTEIMAAGKPAVFVPYPYAAGDHQTLNAQSMVDEEAALMVTDADLSSGEFIEKLKLLLRDTDRLQRMGDNAVRLYRSKATEQTAEVCLEYLNA